MQSSQQRRALPSRGEITEKSAPHEFPELKRALMNRVAHKC